MNAKKIAEHFFAGSIKKSEIVSEVVKRKEGII